MGHAADGAHQSFGVYGTLVVEVVIAEDLQVGLCQDVDRGILCIAISYY